MPAVSTPEVEPTLAIEGLLLVQVPPAVETNVTEVPIHSSVLFLIAIGSGLTVTIRDMAQPDASE